jgi:hypothetical protein
MTCLLFSLDDFSGYCLGIDSGNNEVAEFFRKKESINNIQQTLKDFSLGFTTIIRMNGQTVTKALSLISPNPRLAFNLLVADNKYTLARCIYSRYCVDVAFDRAEIISAIQSAMWQNEVQFMLGMAFDIGFEYDLVKIINAHRVQIIKNMFLSEQEYVLKVIYVLGPFDYDKAYFVACLRGDMEYARALIGKCSLSARICAFIGANLGNARKRRTK